jgi:hypothetical protein
LLFAHETRAVLVETDGKDLDGSYPVQRRLGTAEHHAESTPTDLFGAVESGDTQFRGQQAAPLDLRGPLIAN